MTNPTQDDLLQSTRKKLEKINGLYAFLSQVNKNIVHTTDQATLFQNACTIATKFGHFKVAWIGIFKDGGSTISLEAQSGMPPGDIALFTAVPIQKEAPQREVMRTGKHFTCKDIFHDIKFQHWKPFAERNEIRSCMIIPVKKSGHVIGTLNLYTLVESFSDEREIDLLLEIGNDISLALERIEVQHLQKQTEELVVNNEKRFRALIENGSDLITLSTIHGELIYISPSVTKLFGYTLEDVSPAAAFGFIHPDDLGRYMRKREFVIRNSGSTSQSEIRLLHKNGSWIWCESTLSNRLDEPGVHALVANFRDISERKRAELVQSESKDFIETIYAASLDAVIIIDESGLITRWDQKAESLFGWTEIEVAGRLLSEIIIPTRYRLLHEQGMQRYLNTGEARVLGKTTDISALRRDGNEFDVSLRITSTQVEGRTHFIGFIRDISEKKREEKQKEFDKQNLHALINNTTDLMWSVDRDFKLITCNQPFKDIIIFMSGKSFESESNVMALGFPAEQMKRYKMYYERAFAGETFTEEEYTQIPVDFWSEISFYPIRKGEEVIGTACHSRDITERKIADREKEKMTAELEKAREQDQLAMTEAVISGEEKARQEMGRELHDNINQILATAQLYLGMFFQKNPGLYPLIKKTDELIVSAIKEIRNLAHATISPFIEDDSLAEALATLAMITEKSGAVKIKCSFTNNEQIPLPEKLKLTIYRIVQEQFQNILKYARAHNIGVDIRCDNCTVKLIISDDGIGFDPSQKANGIGMKNIKTRISMYQGKMNVTSSPGKGCTLSIVCSYPCN